MDNAAEDRRKAGQLPDGDVITILLNQHATIHDLLDEVRLSHGEQRQQAFEELRGLLAVHETAGEMVLRPVTETIAASGIADARNAEEQEANAVLEQLESLKLESPEFDRDSQQFAGAVAAHAESEENEEFPPVLEALDLQQRRTLGRRIEAVEKIAPTRPHPGTAGSPARQWTIGPFVALVDRAKDALARARE
ncbi:hemerythrin domain-containing protein [Microlunatus soli]|uniref:Hemerythrin HHE cation binding domain-containing protein n=1 Tax=Microlunatus soli TaxID=630515 RepID=A0A1H1N7J2_9ACTN|nr:hemerythrin domain-containing protein [Microlunatus soli]SDR94850.1 Hemerythrin HHE cation binding domain-containing protein [Microlunatus soli]